jgi:hypothetical protein
MLTDWKQRILKYILRAEERYFQDPRGSVYPMILLILKLMQTLVNRVYCSETKEIERFNIIY